MELLYPKFLAAQIIVMATPIYNWGITSQLKAVFDRWQPIVFDVQEKKKAVLLTTQAGQDD
jgi:multimeric flavodoxin WrbA